MESEQTNLRLRTDIKNRADKAVEKGLIPGIKSLSGLVEFSLDKVLNEIKGA